MSLAQMLKEALERGHRSRPELLAGDIGDPLIDEDQPVTPAAVLVPVVDRDEPTVILTLRPDTLRQHAGQIAFPGGRIDPGDAGPIGAALREADEEIGLSPGHVEVVGLADRYRTVTGYEVTPVLGVVPPDLPLTPQPGEVAGIFEAPLHYLLHPEHQLVRTAMWRGRERTYYEIMWGDRRIWGATAAMIVNLSRRLALTA
ncbi:MAG TPA: CoA pyrophosphatase [Allosphingosinicella sp.]|uniref:CoA pyrophosphatase n=1 Tax=Allosphingosinicella sp. TaxID=2823234 RepID=UPI002EDAB534